jgi:hypothetical protein
LCLSRRGQPSRGLICAVESESQKGLAGGGLVHHRWGGSICREPERESPHAGRAVAGRDILDALVMHVRADLVPEATDVNENPVRLFGFNQACEQLEFRLEILIAHRRCRLFPLDPDDSRVFLDNLQERHLRALCRQHIGP